MIRNYVLIAVLIFGAGGCVTAPGPSVAVSPGELLLKDICAANDISWQWDPITQIADLDYKGARAKVLVGSNIVLVGRERVTLSAPVRVADSSVIAPPDFRDKVVQRLRREATRADAPQITKFRKIIIDAGHGGKDPGAIGVDGVQEKGIVLDISLRLGKILKERGHTVTMTRDTDEFITLEERTKITSRANADLFISVHANSSPARNVTGLEVYVAHDMSLKDRNEDQRRENQKLLFQRLSMAGDSQDVGTIVADMLYTYKQSEAIKFADYLAEATGLGIRAKNRGVKGSRFFVVRNTLIPAVLVEVGFLTNAKEARQLQDQTYRQQIASVLAESIMDYARGR